MKICYDEEGDVLEVQFQLTTPDKRTGISLTDHIILFCDRNFQQALGLTALAYSKLSILSESPSNEFLQAPFEIQQHVKRLMAKAPLNRFVFYDADNIRLEDIRISEMAAV